MHPRCGLVYRPATPGLSYATGPCHLGPSRAVRIRHRGWVIHRIIDLRTMTPFLLMGSLCICLTKPRAVLRNTGAYQASRMYFVADKWWRT